MIFQTFLDRLLGHSRQKETVPEPTSSLPVSCSKTIAPKAESLSREKKTPKAKKTSAKGAPVRQVRPLVSIEERRTDDDNGSSLLNTIIAVELMSDLTSGSSIDCSPSFDSSSFSGGGGDFGGGGAGSSW